MAGKTDAQLISEMKQVHDAAGNLSRLPKDIKLGDVASEMKRFETAEAASQYLITEHSICTVPWDDAGAYLRFSVTYEAPTEADEDALMAATEERLRRIQPLF